MDIPAPEGDSSLSVENLPPPPEPEEKVEAFIPPPEEVKAEKPAEQPQPDQPSAAQEAISVVKQTTEELQGKQLTSEAQPFVQPPPRGAMVRTFPSTATVMKAANERETQRMKIAKS